MTSVFPCRSNLAFTYWLARQLDEAIELGRKTIAARERVLGARHRDTMVSRNNLGVAYMDSGRTDEAIAEHQRNLKDRKATLTPDHPDTLYSSTNLARAFTAASRHAEAVLLHEQTLRPGNASSARITPTPSSPALTSLKRARQPLARLRYGAAGYHISDSRR
jgi:hypothetical protein